MRAAALLSLLALAACQLDDGAAPAAPEPAPAPVPVERVSTQGTPDGPTDADAEAARYVGRGRALSGADTTGQAEAARGNPETLAAVDTTRDWGSRLHLPLGGDVAGPSVAKLQVLLDRAGFSPGQIDGRWGDNTELALTWLQRAESLPATGIADAATVRALARRADAPDSLVATVALSADDVAGPFEPLPDDVYERAALDRLGFESLAEKLGERFHAAPSFLAQLNPGVTLDSLAAGDSLRVPNVRRTARPIGDVARLEISGEGGYLHALAADGTVLFHAPVTVGSSYDPSPEGAFSVTGVALDPSWHYQPSILEGVPDDAEEATLPPGPNNAVGVVWIALSKEHYGIHGTAAPGTIGYASSAGCVRLTNWDARALAAAVGAGTPVRFRDVAGRGAARDSTRASAPRAARTG